MEGAIHELESQEKVDRISVLKVAERFGEPQFGEGTLRLEKANPQLRTDKTILRTLAVSGAVPELDRLGRSVNEKALPKLSEELAKVASEEDPEEVASFIKMRLKEFEK